MISLQIVAHMMPDLPNVGVERDMEQFKVSLPFCALLRSVRKH